MAKLRVEQFLGDFIHWATNQTDIQGVALVGSYARGTATAISDVDLIVLANQPDLYLQNHSWAQAFGKVVNQ